MIEAVMIILKIGINKKTENDNKRNDNIENRKE